MADLSIFDSEKVDELVESLVDMNDRHELCAMILEHMSNEELTKKLIEEDKKCS